MSLFNFFKKRKKIPQNESIKKMVDSLFPNGDEDINAGTNELLRILNNKIS